MLALNRRSRSPVCGEHALPHLPARLLFFRFRLVCVAATRSACIRAANFFALQMPEIVLTVGAALERTS